MQPRDKQELKRTDPKINNVESTPLAERIGSPEVNQTITREPVNLDNTVDQTSAIMDDHYVWLLNAGDTTESGDNNQECRMEGIATICNLPVLNMSIAKSNQFFHDSGANRHIAHD
jgi:hypothetical protein